ncbi:MAG: hypothetical protein LCI00_04245 [Chloroflexi bacterium]|nr:hypothetical protein [Chloroflexota bacterium]MCC6894064.1 hypothetical protein [Anaerolineae bacterium]
MPIPTRPDTTPYEDRDQPTMSIGTVLGFVTEFNANTQIFNMMTLLLLLGLAQMKEIQIIAAKHTQELAGHQQQLGKLEGAVNSLRSQVSSLAARSRDDAPIRPAKHNHSNYVATED